MIYGFHYITGRGAHYRTQYNFNIGLISKPFDRIMLNAFIDYRIKFLNQGIKSNNDLFLRAKIKYDIK